MISKTRNSFVETASLKSTRVQDVYVGTYDFSIGSASWDKRSVAIAESNDFGAKHGVLFHFVKKDDEGLSEKHKSTLEQYYKPRISNLALELIEATSVKKNWSLLKQHLLRASQDLGRPLDVFIDLSTTPRYLTLGVLGVGFRNGIVRSLTYGYSEGKYVSSKNRQELFTEGGWAAVAIPGLSGEWEPHKSRHYDVSVGFEGVKTRQLVSKSEPDRVSVLFPDPPVDESYKTKTQTTNKPLIDDFHVDQKNQLRAHAADVVATLEVMEDASIERFETENCLYVCCGTKPHSLAFAIRSLIKNDPALLYIVPESHRVADVESNGTFWQYKVTACSSPRRAQ